MSIPEGTTEEEIGRWQLVAAELLFYLTGQRYGPSCPVAVRPCRKTCGETYAWLWQGQTLGSTGLRSTGGFVPYMAGGAMYNASFCGCGGTCNCGPELCEVFLPGPVYDVVSVDVDGVTVPPAEYFLYDGQYLVRQSGTGCWPSCQDMGKTSGEGTFTVTYRTGLPLPALGVAALSKLTEHYIKGCNGCGCGVSSGNRAIRSLNRQGVQMEFEDASEVLADGRTGIPIVDQFINAVNPLRLGGSLRVLSPDAPKLPRLTYPATSPSTLRGL